MAFQQIDLSKQRLIDSTVGDCGNIQAYCEHLLAGLSKFFTLSNAQANFGVTFTANDDLVSTISTPYGDARGRLAIQLVDDVIGGRYVFEKNVVSEDGHGIWVPVWAVRISRYGNVHLGDEGTIEIDVANVSPHGNAMTATAKSLLYSIAITPIFSH